MVLKVQNVTKSYAGADGDHSVLQDVSLALAEGDTLALTGESGSGKSTLLHLVGGLDSFDSGSIHVNGRNVGDMDDTSRAKMRRSDVGIIFQQFNLIPSLTVQTNIAFQARLSGVYDAKYAAHLADALGLSQHLNMYPETLSGGQQQRVAIARALVAQPKLILADEPTGNLDEDTASDVMEQMLHLVRETGAALMVVTHSSKVANQMARQVHLRQGRLE